MTKWFTQRANAETIVAMLTLFCTLTLLPGALWQWQAPNIEELFVLALTAIFATGGHYALTKALDAAPISATQPVTFLQLVWATLMGVLLFGEALDVWVLIGGGIIVASASYISYRESVAARTAITPPANAPKT